VYSGWETPLNLLKAEVIQRDYEGYPVPESIKERIAELHGTWDAFNETDIETINRDLLNLPKDPYFKYVQPNELSEIRKERPDGPRQLPFDLNENDLLDLFHGSWTGRACGCALGKPVEMLGMLGANGLSGRMSIKSYLEKMHEVYEINS